MAEWEGARPMKWKSNRRHVGPISSENIKEKVFGGINFLPLF